MMGHKQKARHLEHTTEGNKHTTGHALDTNSTLIHSAYLPVMSYHRTAADV